MTVVEEIEMENSKATFKDALSTVSVSPVVGVLVVGDVAVETLEAVLRACSASVKVGVYNASEETIRAVAERMFQPRVGPRREAVPPRITVVTPETWIIFSDGVTVRSDRPRWFNEIYTGLVPYDGKSLETSLARATPARRDVLDWLASGGEVVSPNVMAFARMRTFPPSRNVLLVLAAVLLVLGLFQASVSVFEAFAGVALLIALALHLNLGSLRRKFGAEHG